MKRPEMARIACEMSNKVILTSDNPRTEDPLVILADMEKGVEAQHFMKTLTISEIVKELIDIGISELNRLN